MLFCNATPYISIIAILAMLFIIPHDPSASLDAFQVGSDAFQLSSTTVTTVRQRPVTSIIATQHERHPVPAAAAAMAPVRLLDRAHEESTELLRLLRLARARPALVLKIAKAAVAPSVRTNDELLEALNGTLGWGTSVDELREVYGGKQHWWGDLTPAETRELYHALLPRSLLDEEGDYTLAERAELAIAARRAARLYARERALLPYALGSELLDGVRQLIRSGSFRVEGPSDEEIWKKYAGDMPQEGAIFNEDVYYTILNKACSTNSHVDRLCGLAEPATAAFSDAAQVAAEIGL